MSCSTGERTTAPTTGSGYYLLASGTLTEVSSGKAIHFRHRQQYSAPFTCSTRHHKNKLLDGKWSARLRPVQPLSD